MITAPTGSQENWGLALGTLKPLMSPSGDRCHCLSPFLVLVLFVSFVWKIAVFATQDLATSPSSVSLRRFRQRSYIPSEADTLWKISQGVVRTVTWNELGTPISLGLWTVGDVVGAALSRVDPYEIECLSDVQVQAIPRTQWRHLTEQLIEYAQESQQLLAILRQERIRDRLWVFLQWLSYKFGHGSSRGRVINLKLSHRAIAEILGTSRVTVTRTLGQLEEEGLMQRHREHWILSQDALTY